MTIHIDSAVGKTHSDNDNRIARRADIFVNDEKDSPIERFDLDSVPY